MSDDVRRRSFKEILVHLREPMLLTTQTGHILAANVAGAEALGTSVAALDGASIASFSSEPARLEAQLASSSNDAFPLRSRDGRRYFCEPSIVDSELRLLRLSGATEPTTRMRLFSETLARLESAIMSSAKTLDEVTQAVLAPAMASLGALAGGVFLLDETGASLELKGAIGYPEKYAERFRLVPRNAPIPLTDGIDAPVFLGSLEDYVAQYPEFTKAHAEIAQRGMACIPLELEGRSIGVLGFGFPLNWVFSEEDRSLLRAFGCECALAIDRAARAETERTIERSASQLHRLHAFTGALAQAITLPNVIEVVVDTGMVATSAQAGGLWILSDDGATVRLVRNVGPTGPTAEEFSKIPVGRGRMPILDAILTGTPVWIESCRHLEELYPETFRAFSKGNEVALACLPLLAQGRSIGGLVFSYTGARRFFENERAFLQLLSWYSAQAIERARLYAAERSAREAAEASRELARDADRRKDEFLAMLGHELRNPLAPIQTALELMHLREGEGFARERAIISRHLQHVVRLVDDLLDVSRMTSGKIQLRKARFEISKLAADSVAIASPALEQRHQSLTLSVPETGLAVIVDRGRLVQAITNLLTNASKYSEPGATIELSAAKEDGVVVIRVRDSGVGIAPEMLPHVFDLFVQENRSLDRAQGGLGIGLTIVRSLIELHGGTVSAHSAGLGQGSDLVIRLPLPSEDDQATPHSERRTHALPQLSKKRVLIVDDNEDAAWTLSQALEQLGYTTQIANDGPAALSIAPSFEPELALLDIGLPVMDGYELAKRFRQTHSATRLIAITGYGQEADRSRSRDSGFDEHIVKPVDLEMLIEILKRLE